MNGYVKSSPHFLRPLTRAMVGWIVVLMLLAALVPAPLEIAADPGHPPNPAKSAWFLLWVQELVSHSTLAIYAALALSALLVALPWVRHTQGERAAWFQREQWPVIAGVLLAGGLVIGLTAVGLFCRGANWRLVVPF
jgi:hypothetical protein